MNENKMFMSAVKITANILNRKRNEKLQLYN